MGIDSVGKEAGRFVPQPSAQALTCFLDSPPSLHQLLTSAAALGCCPQLLPFSCCPPRPCLQVHPRSTYDISWWACFIPVFIASCQFIAAHTFQLIRKASACWDECRWSRLPSVWVWQAFSCVVCSFVVLPSVWVWQHSRVCVVGSFVVACAMSGRHYEVLMSLPFIEGCNSMHILGNS